MDVENDFIKPIVIFYYNKGLSELEACNEISKKYRQYGITTRTINKWYKLLKSEEDSQIKKPAAPVYKISDEYLIDLINKNPGLNLTELGKLAGTAASTISVRLKEINRDGERVKYKHKSRGRSKKLTDEYLINLANQNPEISLYELSSLAGVSVSALKKQINQINSIQEKIKFKPGKTIKDPNSVDESLSKSFNENPEVKIEELGKIIDVTPSIISPKPGNINSKGEKSESSYKCCKSVSNKDKNSKTKITKQQIIDLISENPDLNVEELAKLANVSSRTFSDRLKNISIEDMKMNYDRKSNSHKSSDDITNNFVNDNSDLNMEDLPELKGTPIKTSSRPQNQINFNEKLGKCSEKKLQKPQNYFSDEFLIDLVNKNPELNMTELGVLADTTASTISTRLREINKEGERASYKHKLRGKSKKFTDEFLINLINENPDTNIVNLSLLVGTSTSTVSKRIRKINSTEEKIKCKLIKTSKRSSVNVESLINLVDENPDLTMQELGQLVGVTASTISRRLSKIKNEGENLKYSYKNCNNGIPDKGHSNIRLTKQRVIDLINENPELNMTELAKLANVSTGTISYHIKKINCKDTRVNYIYKYIRKADI
jgi:transcriptional antiterminator